MKIEKYNGGKWMFTVKKKTKKKQWVERVALKISELEKRVSARRMWAINKKSKVTETEI